MQRHQAAEECRDEGRKGRAAELKQLRAVERHCFAKLLLTPRSRIESRLPRKTQTMIGRPGIHIHDTSNRTCPRRLRLHASRSGEGCRRTFAARRFEYCTVSDAAREYPAPLC